MLPRSGCTENLDWEDLLAGVLPPEVQLRCEHHLETCPECQAGLELAVRNADPLLDLARRAGDPTTRTLDPEMTRFMARVQVLGSECGDRTAQSPEPPDLYFLEPSERPELLGVLGGYEVQAVVGQGGMGIVLGAYEPILHRRVAIKVMAPALAGSVTARRRFIREAQAAAAVCHDHIVAVHGVHETKGLPYLVMQYIDGESLQARIDRIGPLEVTEIVRIALQTATALAAAHSQGLIHRDIKPANILLENCLARVKITDFGLARMVDDVSLTQVGIVAGTPEYMAPEQARGESLDHRADLFSLGSVLYAMATGQPPFRGASTVAVLRQVSDMEPRAVRELNPDVPAWLETMIRRLHVKNADERLQTAAEVATLLEGYLAHLRQPVSVAPPEHAVGVAEFWNKAVRKRRRLALAGVVVALSSLMAIVEYLAYVHRPTAVVNLDMAAGPVKPVIDGTAPLLQRLHGHTGSVHNVLFASDGRLVSVSGFPQGDSTLRVWDTKQGTELVRFPTATQVQALDLSADGRFALLGLNDGKILYLDLERKELVWPPIRHQGVVSWVAFAPDGKHLFSTAIDGTARRWRLSDGQEVGRFQGLTKWVRAGALSPDGERLVTGDNNGTLQVWDVESATELKRIERRSGWISSLAVTADGRQVLIADREAALYDLESGKVVRLFEGHGDLVQQAAISPNGRHVLTGGYDGIVRLWDFRTGRLVQCLGKHDGFVCSVAFSPNGLAAASAGGGHRDGNGFRAGTDHDIRLWDVSAGTAASTAP